MLSTEELLKPRWKVIAAFPDNRNYEVGTILDRDWCRYVNDEDESEGVIWKISDFPHLFKKLEWWEDRDEKDLPEYVKFIRLDNGQLKVVKVTKWIKKDDGVIFSNGTDFYSANNDDTPATREEYEQYLSQNKSKK